MIKVKIEEIDNLIAVAAASVVSALRPAEIPVALGGEPPPGGIGGNRGTLPIEEIERK
jgi:hypothetical protein